MESILFVITYLAAVLLSVIPMPIPKSILARATVRINNMRDIVELLCLEFVQGEFYMHLETCVVLQFVMLVAHRNHNNR